MANSDRSAAILGLCGSLYDQDASVLQLKLIKFLKEHTHCQCAFILHVTDDTEELFCKVIGEKILEEEIKFLAHSSSYSIVLQQKRPLTLEDIDLEHRQDIYKMLGYDVSSMLCVPVNDPISNKIIAIACAVNKEDDENFHEEDAEIIQEVFRYTVPVLTSTLAYQKERRLKNQTQSLLQVARNLFIHLDDVTVLLSEIMQEAKNLTHAERCSLFLLDDENNELVAKVFDGNLTSEKEEQCVELRIPADQGIAGHVATRGEILNIKDAYAHPLFYRGVDETTGFRTRNILCFPIKGDQDVVGVAELCNKINGACFTSFDEEIAMAFSIFCGISIMHSLMYQKVRDAQYRSKLSNELMMYHMQSLTQVFQDDIKDLSQCEIPSAIEFHPEFLSFSFTPRLFQDNKTTMICLSMFNDMGMISRWRIRREVLAKFILMVKKGYRDPPYHNWTHAFSVGHFCYLLVKNLGLFSVLTDLEIFSLFVACLCHDLDHRGTTNSFQVASQSVLAALYSSEGSVMERHHFAQAMCIINTENCNIFESLSSKEYQKCLDYMRANILATDLAHHLKICKDIRKLTKEGFDKNNQQHHNLLLFLLMTSCDLSDQTKPWKSSKSIAKLVYHEFFSQGDLEKAMGNRPMEMMDREKACVPELQVSFIDQIALPVYEMLGNMFTGAQEVEQAVKLNRLYWAQMKEVYLEKQKANANTSMDIFEDEELESEVINSVSNNGIL